jgi:putative inorganic carbon (HCO3(-)) transporter
VPLSEPERHFFIQHSRDADVTTTNSPVTARLWQRNDGWRATPASALICLLLCSNFLITIGHDFQRVAQVCSLALFGSVLLVTRKWPGLALLAPSTRVALGTFFLLGVLSSLHAYMPRFALYEVSTYFLLLLFALSVAREISAGGRPALLRVLQLVAVGCCLHTVTCLSAYAGAMALHIPLEGSDFAVGFSNIRFFNHTQTSLLPLLALLCCLTPRHARVRWLWLALTSYWWTAIYATSGRGTLAAVVAGSLATALFQRRHAVAYLKQLITTAVLGLALYFVLFLIIPVLTGNPPLNAFSAALARTASDPASGRGALWRFAAGLIEHNPWLGVGPMHFAHAANRLQMGAHPHDWMLQIASEWGMPALICLVFTLWVAFRGLIGAVGRFPADDVDNQTTLSALMTGCAAILVDACVSGVLVMPQSQIAITLLLGCTIGWYRSVVRPAPGSPSERPRRRLAAAVCLVAAMAGMMAGAGPGMKALLDGELPAARQQAANPGFDWPRMWQQGYF